MKTTTIELRDIRVYAYHGCLREEEIVGSDYNVEVIVQANLSTAFETDSLSDTIDYVLLNRIVKEEMRQRSKLLEHVGMRIIKRIFKEVELAMTAEVAISKLNPPIGGDVKSVCVRIFDKKDFERR